MEGFSNTSIVHHTKSNFFLLYSHSSLEFRVPISTLFTFAMFDNWCFLAFCNSHMNYHPRSLATDSISLLGVADIDEGNNMEIVDTLKHLNPEMVSVEALGNVLEMIITGVTDALRDVETDKCTDPTGILNQALAAASNVYDR